MQQYHILNLKQIMEYLTTAILIWILNMPMKRMKIYFSDKKNYNLVLV